METWPRRSSGPCYRATVVLGYVIKVVDNIWYSLSCELESRLSGGQCTLKKASIDLFSSADSETQTKHSVKSVGLLVVMSSILGCNTVTLPMDIRSMRGACEYCQLWFHSWKIYAE